MKFYTFKCGCTSANGASDHYVREGTDLSEAEICEPNPTHRRRAAKHKMEGNDRQQANKDNITRPTNLENTTSSAIKNVVRTVEPQTSMFASAERLSNANGATTTYGKERILAKPRFVNQTQPIEDGPPNIKMEGNDRQQANKDNITRLTNLENTTSSANVVRTVEPQTSMFASAERLPK
ncbi:hypothetical protein Bbelb_301370 [Branchiostoma belcheri]|nr:hypothetical protein Bbelb_301370 [Branchiostoma belcheri]